MRNVRAIAVPRGSLLAAFGGPDDYRDAFVRDVPGEFSLEQFIERFYSSAAFGPERVVLGLLGRSASRSEIRALACGEADRLAVWEVVERTPTEILLESTDTGTASWLAVEPVPASDDRATGQAGTSTRLLFGSWVGGVEQTGWRFMLQPHRWYSVALLAGC